MTKSNGATDALSPVRWQLWIVALGFFMQTLDTTIVNTALPAMALSLNTSPLQMHSVIVSYLLTVAVMLPVSGWLADRFGVRNVFFSAILLFSFGSLCCAFSTSLHELILARVVQGVGGAMMVPVGRLTVMRLVPRSQYMAAMTFVTIPGQIGPLLGPTLGGVLVEYASWHWIFLINLPVGAIGALATLRLLPNFTQPIRRFDFTGFFLLSVGMATLTLAMDGERGLGVSAWVLGLFILTGIIALLFYLLHARHNDRALFSLKLFNNRVFSIGLLGNLTARIGSGMLPFMTPLFLQVGLGYSPLNAGLMMIPMVLGSMGIKRIVVQIVNRIGYRMTLVSSTIALALITLLFPVVALTGWGMLMPLVLFLLGMANAIRFSAMNTLTLKDLSDELASSGNSLMAMVQQLSMSIGVSVAGLLLGAFGQQAAAGSPLMQQGFISTYLCMALVIALPALVFWRVPRDTTLNAVLARRRKK